MPLGIPRGARCVQRFDDSLKICNSHYLSHFAAFFIDARAKRSVVESCTLVLAHDNIFHYIRVCVKFLCQPKRARGQRFTGYWMKATDVHLPVLASTEGNHS